jgi:hypothetical protein
MAVGHNLFKWWLKAAHENGAELADLARGRANE